MGESPGGGDFFYRIGVGVFFGGDTGWPYTDSLGYGS
jgi:hypothetical protein